MAWLELIKTIKTTPLYIGGLILGVLFLALGMALISQYVFGLHPCVLCIYQRWPYVIAIILGILVMMFKNNVKASALFVGLSSLTFFANSAIAFFHSGVERHWWEGLKGCGTPDMSGTAAELLERIKNMPQAKCSEIPWADPILGGSMANYNVLVCFVMGIICFSSFIALSRRSNGY